MIKFVIVAVITAVQLVLLGCVWLGWYPSRASCLVVWRVRSSCNNSRDGLVQQMNAWSSAECGSGEKCLYHVLAANSTKISAQHTTPVSGFVDDITFTLSDISARDDASPAAATGAGGTAATGAGDGGQCIVEGRSRSRAWYAWLDWGTNYCNMRNVALGLGWVASGVLIDENTNNTVCTQYSSANCDKY